MPTKKDVKEMVELCRSLGLDPVYESRSGHYKVRDPEKNVFLFGISSSPSDPNFKWMIRRHLRRLGLIGQKDRFFVGGGKRKRGKPVIDIDALRIAQQRAEAAGERIPTLDDLEDSTEFFKRIRTRGGISYSADAQEEAIGLMAVKADKGRANATRQRLKKLLEEKGPQLLAQRDKRLKEEGKRIGPSTGGELPEFVRTAIYEVAPARNIRAWKSDNSGTVGLRRFLDEPNSTMQLWTMDLIDATLDHFDGLRFGVVDETRRRVHSTPETQFTPVTPDEDGEPLWEDPTEDSKIVVVPEPVETALDILDEARETLEQVVTAEDLIRTQYAEALFEILRAEGSQVNETILSRLDKLAGIQ